MNEAHCKTGRSCSSKTSIIGFQPSQQATAARCCPNSSAPQCSLCGPSEDAEATKSKRFEVAFSALGSQKLGTMVRSMLLRKDEEEWLASKKTWSQLGPFLASLSSNSRFNLNTKSGHTVRTTLKQTPPKTPIAPPARTHHRPVRCPVVRSREALRDSRLN